MLFTPDERRALLVLAGLLLIGLAARWIAPGPPPPAGGGDSLLTVLAGARDGPPPVPGPPAPGLAADGRIPVNRAGEEELTALPRIGPVLARRIVEERERSGPFRDGEDLRRVRGIGPALAKRLSPLLSFDAADSGAPADCTETVRVARSPRGGPQPFSRN